MAAPRLERQAELFPTRPRAQFDAARANGKEPQLRDELKALARAFNQNGDLDISIQATFMRVTVAR